MGLAMRDDGRYTYADYTRWGDDGRWEVIDGVAYAMAPAPSRRHQDVTGAIYAQLLAALEGHPCRPYIAPFDVRLPRGDEADALIDTVVQPDIAVFCDPEKLDERGARGAPDFVVEVLSPGTAGHDMIRKRRLYERAGVRELWLVHPVDRVVTIFVHDGAEFGKMVVQELLETTEIGALPGVVIEWERVTARLDLD